MISNISYQSRPVQFGPQHQAAPSEGGRNLNFIQQRNRQNHGIPALLSSGGSRNNSIYSHVMPSQILSPRNNTAGKEIMSPNYNRQLGGQRNSFFNTIDKKQNLVNKLRYDNFMTQASDANSVSHGQNFTSKMPKQEIPLNFQQSINKSTAVQDMNVLLNFSIDQSTDRDSLYNHSNEKIKIDNNDKQGTSIMLNKAMKRGLLDSNKLKPVLNSQRNSTAGGERLKFQNKEFGGYMIREPLYKVSVADAARGHMKNPTEVYCQNGFPQGKYPQNQHYNFKPLCFGVSKDEKPRDFLTQHLKKHSLDPGPKYDVHIDMSKRSITKKNPPNFSMKETKIDGHLDSLVKVAKTIPGVGKYESHKNPNKILGCFTQKAPMGAFTEQAIFYGQETPGPYNPIDLDKVRSPRSLHYKFRQPTEEQMKTSRGKPIKKDFEALSPGQYQINYELLSQTHRPISFGMAKSPRRTFTEDAADKFKWVPPPGKYSPEQADRVKYSGPIRRYR